MIGIHRLLWRMRARLNQFDGGKHHARAEARLKSQARAILNDWQRALHAEGEAICQLREAGVSEHRIAILYPSAKVEDWGIDLSNLWRIPALRRRLDHDATRRKWRPLAIGARSLQPNREALYETALRYLSKGYGETPLTVEVFMTLGIIALNLAVEPDTAFRLGTRPLARYLRYLERLTPLLNKARA